MSHAQPPNDTSPDVERKQLEIYRQITPGRKWQLLDGMYRMARQLHAAGVRINNPRASDDEILTAWLRATLDESLFNEVQRYREELGRRAVCDDSRRSAETLKLQEFLRRAREEAGT